MLFKKGDLRYAVFSANEGLELCVKAHMLRYKIIDEPMAAGHFPYHAAVKRMKEIILSNMQRDLHHKKRLEEALKLVGILEEAFNMMKKKKFVMTIWKSSLGIDLTNDEKKRIKTFWKKLDVWGKKTSQMQNKQERVGRYRYNKLTPNEKGVFVATAVELGEDKIGLEKNFQMLPASENKKMIDDRKFYTKEILALLELVICTNVIICSSAHQQISRYPTRIGGVDSQKIYIQYKDNVKKLLEKIYGVFCILLEDLKSGSPFLAQSVVTMIEEAKKYMRDDEQISRYA